MPQRKGVGVISALEIPMVKDSTKESARHDTETFEYKTWHGEKRGVLPIRDVRQKQCRAIRRLGYIR
jgi:hypothetical protein